MMSLKPQTYIQESISLYQHQCLIYLSFLASQFVLISDPLAPSKGKLKTNLLIKI